MQFVKNYIAPPNVHHFIPDLFKFYYANIKVIVSKNKGIKINLSINSKANQTDDERYIKMYYETRV